MDSTKSKGKPFSSNHDSNASVTTSSPQKPTRTGGVTDAKLEESKTLLHVEEKMNTNAVVEFIRGLNIDSRQQDGSATDDVDANMEEFLRVPFRIEKLLLFGVAVCFDCFLNVLTVTHSNSFGVAYVCFPHLLGLEKDSDFVGFIDDIFIS